METLENINPLEWLKDTDKQDTEILLGSATYTGAGTNNCDDQD